ncbi:MAG TPA: hypothetical protein VLY45_01880 [Nitrospiria bacterium]|nr:hypothetical protein [Nitrospiria bacterium]
MDKSDTDSAAPPHDPSSDATTPSPSGSEAAPAAPVGAERLPLFASIQRMSVAERMQFARRADKEGRGLLIRDSNRQVALSALTNPKVTIQEVEQFAKSRQLDTEILRLIGTNVEWLKQYAVVHALVANPRTPVPIALKLLPRLKTLDLKILGTDRNLPSVVRIAATRLMKSRREGG